MAVKSVSPAWIIMRASKADDGLDVSENNAYKGPVAKLAGVHAGKIYFTESHAKADAKKLTASDPRGFTVVRLR